MTADRFAGVRLVPASGDGSEDVVVALDDTGRTMRRSTGTIDGSRMLTGVRESRGRSGRAAPIGDCRATLSR